MKKTFFAVAVACLFALSAFHRAAVAAAAFPAGFVDKVVAAGLSSPTGMAFPGDGRVFVAQQMGPIAVIRDDSLLPQPLATLRVDFNTERGLLGIAVDPDFAANHWVYVYYTCPAPNPHMRLSRFTEQGNAADTSKETVLIEFPDLPVIPSVKSINVPGTTNLAVWHMGGALLFAGDGKLFIGVGEHMQSDSAQKLTNVFGKILRVNRDGTIPEDDPFYATGTGLAKAIWAYGLRNPFTLALQPKTGKLFANDVGDRTWEEVDVVEKGRNFGWKTSEGATTDPNFTTPLYTYKHTEGCAVMGGGFSDPALARFPPEYAGRYFVADFCKGWIRTLDPATGEKQEFASGILYPTGLKFSPDGRLYYLERGQATGAIKAGAAKVHRVTNPVGDAVAAPAPRNRDVTQGRIASLGGPLVLRAPARAVRVEVFDASGQLVFATRVAGGMARLPAGVPQGALTYRWVSSPL